MSDDPFIDIRDEVKKLNDQLASYGKSLSSIVADIRNDLKGKSDGDSSDDESASKPKSDKQASITQKLITQLRDVSKRYGKANLVSNATNGIAQRAADISKRLGRTIGSDGDSEADPRPKAVKSSQTATKPVQQATAAISQQLQGMAVKATRVSFLDHAPPKAGTLMGQALARQSAPAAVSGSAATGIAAAGAESGLGEAAAGAGGVAAGGLAAAAGPAAAIAAVVAGVVAACAALAVGVVALTKKMIESAKELAKVNGKIASAFALSQVRQVKRDIRSGNATGGSTANLIRTFDDFKDKLAPIGNKLTNLVNTILTRIVSFFNKLLDFFKPLLDAIGDIADTLSEWFGDTKKKNTGSLLPVGEFLEARRTGNNRHDPLFRWSTDPKRRR